MTSWSPRRPTTSESSTRTYDDGKPHRDYLEWTGRWVAATARALASQGSLFLNVGAKPTEPWTALDVAQAARPHLRLQNILHWIKSIAIEAEAAGGRAGLTDDLAVGHYKPINSSRFLNDCHEFVFHFTPEGVTRLDRLALGVKYQDASNVSRWRAAAGGRRCRGNTWFIPYETIQSREKDRPHPATFPSRLPGPASAFTGPHACRPSPTRSSGSAPPPWPAPGWGSAPSGSSSTSTTCKRRSPAPAPPWPRATAAGRRDARRSERSRDNLPASAASGSAVIHVASATYPVT